MFIHKLVFEQGEQMFTIQNALFYKQMYACVSEVFESASTGWIDGYVCIAWTPISNLVITGQESSVTQEKEIDVLD